MNYELRIMNDRKNAGAGIRNSSFTHPSKPWRSGITHNLRKASGFTLIELLVVMVVLSILALVIMVSVGHARVAARDTTRKGDLKALEAAAEQLWADERCYPNTPSNNGSGVYYLNADTIVQGWISPAKTLLTPKYINPLPEDPAFKISRNLLTDFPYEYESKQDNDGDGVIDQADPNNAGVAGCKGGAYRFVTFLENQNNVELTDDFIRNTKKYLQLASPGWPGNPPGNY